MSGDIKSSSPGGRYVVRTHPWEARMSLWIETPELFDTAAGQVLLGFKDTHWSVDSADWRSESVVAMHLRKYPGDHLPGSFEAVIDCERRTASLNGAEAGSLDHLEESLAQAYSTGHEAWTASQAAAAGPGADKGPQPAGAASPTPQPRSAWAIASIVLCGLGYGQALIGRACDEMACLSSGLVTALLLIACLVLGLFAALVAAIRGERGRLVWIAFLLSLGPLLYMLVFTLSHHRT
jgi:hypothetical protein